MQAVAHGADTESVRYEDAVVTPAAARAGARGGDSRGMPSGVRPPVPAGGALPVPAAFHVAIVRPLTRRRHVRVAGATAGGMERLAWARRDRPAGEPAPVSAAVSIVPGTSRPGHGSGSAPRSGFVPLAGFAVLDDVVGEQEAGCAPGRHRHEPLRWQLLRHVPGWRPSPPSREQAADAPADADSADAADDTEQLEAAAPPVRSPAPAPAADLAPTVRRRRREPVPAVRAALIAAQARITAADGATAIARVAAEEAAALTDAHVSAVVLRAVEGPRLLWLHPGGPDAADLWGPATLAALLGVGHPVRRVVEGDPLAGGSATALLAVPMPSGGSVVGSLLVRRHTARAFSAGEQDVLSRLARMTGAALVGAAPVATAEPGPKTDAVTGWPGPRRFAADAGAAVRTADRHGMAVRVVAAHLDGLARVRADLGQEAADGVLRTLAVALGEVLRVGDVAYRIGEDQLALLLPATDDEALPALRSRFRDVVDDVLTAVALPGERRGLGVRTAPVPLDTVREGMDAVDAALGAVGVTPPKVRWALG